MSSDVKLLTIVKEQGEIKMVIILPSLIEKIKKTKFNKEESFGVKPEAFYILLA